MSETQAPQFDAWLDDYFATYYRLLPVNATFIGVHSQDARLPDWSAAGLDAAIDAVSALRTRLHALPDEPLTQHQALDRKLAAGALAIHEWELRSDHFQRGNPALYTGEAIFALMSLFLRPYAPIAERVDAAIERMNGIETFLAGARETIATAPPAWTDRALRECEGALLFCREGVDALMEDEGIDNPSLRAAADRAADAFAGFARYLEDELRNHPRANVACGAQAFELLMRQGHFLSESVDEMLAHAEAVHAESRAALAAGAAAFGTDSWQEALAGLADLHPSADDYYAAYQQVWDACRDAALEHDLISWPEDYPIRYVPRPRWSRAAAPYLYFLFYRAPAAFDPIPDVVPVVDYLVTPLEGTLNEAQQEEILRATNDSVIKLNHVVHHGSIGHHVQNARARHARSRIGQMAAVDGASRIALFCGGTMAEGWSCYVTDLMAEVGFLTPLEEYSQLYGRMRMAARTIVDIRLHRGDFTLEQAAAFYHEQVGMSEGASMGEAVKNSMFPGGAVMYLSGTDAIFQLRREVAAAQGGAFSLRAFHDELISHGSVPISLVAEMMREEQGITE